MRVITWVQGPSFFFLRERERERKVGEMLDDKAKQVEDRRG